MRRMRRSMFSRYFVIVFVLLFNFACESEEGCASCDTMIQPMEAPLAESDLTYDAVQLRVAERTFLYIEEHFPQIVQMVLPDGGISFDIPPTTVDVIIPITLCGNGCHIDVFFTDWEFTTWTPNNLEIGFELHIQGQIDIYGVAFIFRIDCDIPITMDKWIDFDIELNIDPATGYLEIGIDDFDFEINYDDFGLQCSGLLGATIEDVHGEMVDMMNEAVQDSLADVIQTLLDTLNCLPCDFYESGCPGGSSCVEGICRQGSACVNAPLGLVGNLNMGALLGLGGPPSEMPLFLAAGQRGDAHSDQLVRYESLEVRLIGGAGGPRHPCVGPLDPADIPPTTVPERFDFQEYDDYVPGTETDDYEGTQFMVGVEVSDVYLDRMMYGAYNSGALCLAIGSDFLEMGTATIGLLGLDSLDDLLGPGHNAPLLMKARPTKVPQIDIGANTQTTDVDGNLVMDQPLLFVNLPAMDVDVYTLLANDWIRLLTVNLDIGVDLGLALTPENQIIVLLDEESIKLTNVSVFNDELLSEYPAALAETLPMLVGLLIPALAIEPIELPPLAGIQLDLLALKGDMRRPGTDFYEYLGLYLDFALGGKRAPRLDTWAKVAEVLVPFKDEMSIHHEGGMLTPEVVLAVGTDSDPAAEYSYRLDNGFWSTFRQGSRLTLKSPRLAKVGQHSVEVRARTVGDYMTLDDTPVSLTFTVPPPPSRSPTENAPDTGGDVLESQSGSFLETETSQLEEGCACGTHAGQTLPSLMLLGLLGLILRRRS